MLWIHQLIFIYKILMRNKNCFRRLQEPVIFFYFSLIQSDDKTDFVIVGVRRGVFATEVNDTEISRILNFLPAHMPIFY